MLEQLGVRRRALGIILSETKVSVVDLDKQIQNAHGTDASNTLASSRIVFQFAAELPTSHPYKAKATAAAAAATPAKDPARWLAPPAKGVGEGEPVVTEPPLVPFVPTLLTMRDGHGVASDTDGVLRVIILSGAAEGQAVPQGASMVDYYRVRIYNATANVLSRKLCMYQGVGANC